MLEYHYALARQAGQRWGVVWLSSLSLSSHPFTHPLGSSVRPRNGGVRLVIISLFIIQSFTHFLGCWLVRSGTGVGSAGRAAVLGGRAGAASRMQARGSRADPPPRVPAGSARAPAVLGLVVEAAASTPSPLIRCLPPRLPACATERRGIASPALLLVGWWVSLWAMRSRAHSQAGIAVYDIGHIERYASVFIAISLIERFVRDLRATGSADRQAVAFVVEVINPRVVCPHRLSPFCPSRR